MGGTHGTSFLHDGKRNSPLSAVVTRAEGTVSATPLDAAPGGTQTFSCSSLEAEKGGVSTADTDRRMKGEDRCREADGAKTNVIEISCSNMLDQRLLMDRGGS
jgi:hypothetical protein